MGSANRKKIEMLLEKLGAEEVVRVVRLPDWGTVSSGLIAGRYALLGGTPAARARIAKDLEKQSAIEGKVKRGAKAKSKPRVKRSVSKRPRYQSQDNLVDKP